jgi:hypothetical protein
MVMDKKAARRPIAAFTLIFLHVFLGLNGLLGGGALMLKPDGSLLQMPLSNMQGAPFADFTWPGLLLFLFLGVYPLAVAYCLWKVPSWEWPQAINPFKQMHWSWAGSLAAGVIAIVWIAVQVLWIPFFFLQGFILGWGILIVLNTLVPSVRRYYEV